METMISRFCHIVQVIATHRVIGFLLGASDRCHFADTIHIIYPCPGPISRIRSTTLMIKCICMFQYPELPRYPNHRNTVGVNGHDNKTLQVDSKGDDGLPMDTNMMHPPTLYPRQNGHQASAPQEDPGTEDYNMRRMSNLQQHEGYPPPFSYLKGPAVLPRIRQTPEPEYIEPEDQPPPWFQKPTQVRRKDTPMDPQDSWRKSAESYEPQRGNSPQESQEQWRRPGERNNIPMDQQEQWRRSIDRNDSPRNKTPVDQQEQWRRSMERNDPPRNNTPMDHHRSVDRNDSQRNNIPMDHHRSVDRNDSQRSNIPMDPRRSVDRSDSQRNNPQVDLRAPWRKPVDRNDSQRSSASVQPPEELRSQLPWSYYRPRDAQMKNKLKPTHETVAEEMPPVPVPDYTLHFGKSARPGTSWPESSSTPNHGKYVPFVHD